MNLLTVCLDLHVRIFPVFLGIIFPLISGSYALPLSQQNIVGNGASRQETEKDQTFLQWFAVGLTRFGWHLVQGFTCVLDAPETRIVSIGSERQPSVMFEPMEQMLHTQSYNVTLAGHSAVTEDGIPISICTAG